jgi:phosphoglycerol transferase MdoB-like AlkP superfamily enzyme
VKIWHRINAALRTAVPTPAPREILAATAAIILSAGASAGWARILDVDLSLRHDWLYSSVDVLALEVLLLNAAVGIALYLFFRIIFSRAAATLLSASCSLAFAAISAAKMRILGMPLLPWDIWFVHDLGHLTRFADLTPAIYVLGAAAAAAVVLKLTGIIRIRAFRQRLTLAGTALGIGAAAVLVLGIQNGYADHLSTAGLQNIRWDQGANFHNHGPFYTFVVNLGFVSIDTPSPQARQSAAAIDLLKQGGSPRDSDLPDVVTILAESFTDLPTRIFNRPYTCLADAPVSKLVTPAWGGYTANVEFELLTGYPYALFPAGSVPYQMYLKHPVQEALPRLFARAGYDPIALHTFDRAFFSRPSAYEMLGFSDYDGLQDFPSPSLRGQYVDDKFVFEETLRRLDRASSRPRFVHAVTMMAHLPYNYADRYPVHEELHAALPPELGAHRTALTLYASLMYDHERMFCDFLDALKKRSQRTIVLFYGDHYPTFGSVAVYEDVHAYIHRADPVEFDLYSQYSETPVVMFDSASGFVSLPPKIPAYNLGTYLLRHAGLPLESLWAMPHKLDNRVIVGTPQRGTQDAELATLKAHAYLYLIAPE